MPFPILWLDFFILQLIFYMLQKVPTGKYFNARMLPSQAKAHWLRRLAHEAR